MSKQNIVIAIDGMCAAYKTTTANALANKLLTEGITAEVVHCDDFFLPSELRTRERLSRPGGNIHYERLKEEVLDKLHSGENITYRRFDCSKMNLGEMMQLHASRVYIIEGAYALHPFFDRYYDLAVFMKVSREEQLERIRNRNGRPELFEQKWIPLELQYHEAFETKELADIVIDTTDVQTDAVTCVYRAIKTYL